jgi:hypothetical protein
VGWGEERGGEGLKRANFVHIPPGLGPPISISKQAVFEKPRTRTS